MRAAWRTDAEYKATRRRTSRKNAFQIVSRRHRWGRRNKSAVASRDVI